MKARGILQDRGNKNGLTNKADYAIITADKYRDYICYILIFDKEMEENNGKCRCF